MTEKFKSEKYNYAHDSLPRITNSTKNLKESEIATTVATLANNQNSKQQKSISCFESA